MPSNAMGSCAKFELATAAAQVERDCWTPAAAAAAESGGAERVRCTLSNCARSAVSSFWSLEFCQASAVIFKSVRKLNAVGEGVPESAVLDCAPTFCCVFSVKGNAVYASVLAEVLEAGAAVAAVRNEGMVDLVVSVTTVVDGEAVVETANATNRSLIVVAGPPFDLRC
jgi:hypothetical protein